MKTLVALLFAALLNAQPTQVSITGPAPDPVQAGGHAVGLRGGATLYYWVIARYPIGASAPTPVMVPNTVGPVDLSVANYVNLTWNAMPGATGYDVLRSSTSTYPAPCAACAVVINTALTAVQDTGAALTSYPPVGVVSAPVTRADITLDNQTDTKPFLRVSIGSESKRLPTAPPTPPTSGNCVQWGANGNQTDAGAPCGTGAGTSIGCEPSMESNIATIAAPCQGNYGPNQIKLTGNATLSSPGGTGAVYAYFRYSALYFGLYSSSGTCNAQATCEVLSSNEYPAGVSPIARWINTAGTLGTTRDDRSAFSSDGTIVGGTDIGAVRNVNGDLVINYTGTGGGVLPGNQTFNASGTFTPAANVTRVYVEVWGPGGGGRGNNFSHNASGGGGGGYAAGWCATTPGVGVTVTVGTKGTGGVGNTNGTNGSGPSSFGSCISAEPGTGGVTSLGGYGGRKTGTPTRWGIRTSDSLVQAMQSAAGGQGLNGLWPDLGGNGANPQGTTNAAGLSGGFAMYGGGGGGGTGNGTGDGGAGGISGYGGAGGRGGDGQSGSGVNCTAGTAPGGGGGGAIGSASGATTGCDGADGRVIVWW